MVLFSCHSSSPVGVLVSMRVLFRNAAQPVHKPLNKTSTPHQVLIQIQDLSCERELFQTQFVHERPVFRCCQESPPLEIRSAGMLPEWAAFAMEDGKICVFGHWCFKNCWWLHDGSTCDRQSVASANSYVGGVRRTCSRLFTCCRGEHTHSGSKVWLPLSGADSEQFSFYVVPSEATPVLFGLDMIREFGLVIDVSFSFCYSTRL